MGERGSLEKAGLVPWDFSFFFSFLHPLCPPCEGEVGNDGWVGCASEGYTHGSLPHSHVPAGMWGLLRQPHGVPKPRAAWGTHSSSSSQQGGSCLSTGSQLDHPISHIRANPGMASGSLGSFTHPGKALPAAPHFPRVTRAGGVFCFKSIMRKNSIPEPKGKDPKGFDQCLLTNRSSEHARSRDSLGKGVTHTALGSQPGCTGDESSGWLKLACQLWNVSLPSPEYHLNE